MRNLPAFIAIIAAFALCVGCHNERKVDVAAGLNPDVMPSMKTENVATMISDSGIIQYKIVSPVWYVYDAVDTPYWHFPKGVYLRKFDRKFRVIATVAADSARYFKQQRLWKLDGHVEMQKEPKTLFLTEQLFWNERERQLYSDSFIHIETPENVLEGHGFVSNDRLTAYRIIRPTGIFPVERHEMHRDTSSIENGNSGGIRLRDKSEDEGYVPPKITKMPNAHSPAAMPAARPAGTGKTSTARKKSK